MKILQHIIQYDWYVLKANRTFLLSLALLLAFTGLAFWNGAARVKFQQQTIAAIQKTEAAHLAENKALVASLEQIGKPFTGNSHRDPTNPYAVANARGNRYVWKNPSPLTVLSVGQSDLLPYYFKFAFNKKQALYHSEEIENASVLYNGYFDFSFLVAYLLPLLIIAITYNTVSSEREQGTLSLVLAGNTDFRTIILYKYLFRFALFTGVLVALTLLGVIFSGINPARDADGFAFLIVLLVAYTAFWFALSFFVNSLHKSIGFNVGVLTGAWLTMTLVVPTVLNVLVQLLHPMPSRIELIAETREASDLAKKAGSQLLAQYYEDHPELAPRDKPLNMNDFAISSVRTTLAVEEAIRPLERQFAIQHQKQQALIQNYRWLSPVIFVQQSLNEIAGTSEMQLLHFQEETTHLHQQYRTFFSEKIFRQEKFTAADYDRIPVVRYQPPSLPIFNLPNVANVGFLAVLGAVLIAIGLARSRQVQLA